MQKLLTVKEVAKMLKLSPATIWRMDKNNSLPQKRKIGKRSVRWLEDDILNWIDNKFHSGTPSS